MSAVKKTIKRYRDVVLGNFAHLISEHDSRTQAKIEALERSLRELELGINHGQMQLLRETNERLKNSGTVYLSEDEILTKIFSGLKMYLNPHDLAITPHLALDSIWEHRITTAWLAVVKPNDTVLDIGSNNGYYGALAAQKTDKKHSKVVMFEANPHLIPYIRKTLAVNWLNEQTTLENLAVGDKEGQLTLHILKDYVGSSSVYDSEHVGQYMNDKMYIETAEEVTVPSVTIDGYCKKHSIKTVDLIIMDIEGFEDKAYVGMRRTIQESPSPTLFIEFTPGSYADPKGFYDMMLKDFGHVYVLDDDGYIVRPSKSDYEHVIGDVDDWVMPIFSKDQNLANLRS